MSQISDQNSVDGASLFQLQLETYRQASAHIIPLVSAQELPKVTARAASPSWPKRYARPPGGVLSK